MANDKLNEAVEAVVDARFQFGMTPEILENRAWRVAREAFIAGAEWMCTQGSPMLISVEAGRRFPTAAPYGDESGDEL